MTGAIVLRSANYREGCPRAECMHSRPHAMRAPPLTRVCILRGCLGMLRTVAVAMEHHVRALPPAQRRRGVAYAACQAHSEAVATRARALWRKPASDPPTPIGRTAAKAAGQLVCGTALTHPRSKSITDTGLPPGLPLEASRFRKISPHASAHLAYDGVGWDAVRCDTIKGEGENEAWARG
eukprot:CAMPEP_0181228098 /NCGR_PEP_ID=MMETSP1096-20121128/33165_1 /TAXON_ID=156174 ORGANISM="Chrysochromulina ericina, Strain CCMP281" /NCGR_SAMPLE_ID=MMETSP1096 /ASSEMBLY_ACC=CAM_ASM_000453 /LENGTH=180 /DNA_ID=CAMNT_0023321597 /DNA_START=136 /DNA_END=677 /DNA_ORIENTATION=-